MISHIFDFPFMPSYLNSVDKNLMIGMEKNILYYGDNLDILRRYIKDETIDLIYLDPPFKSNQDYNVLFAEQNGTRSPAQIKAFEDTWHWDRVAAETYEEVVLVGDRVSEVLQGFRNFLGENDMMAYLSMMSIRLKELHRVLKPTGSIYLHCDPTASHYLKILMDAVFGGKNFRNEITWFYHKWMAGENQFQRNHDIIYFYTKSSENIHTFNPLYVPHTEETMKRWKGHRQLVTFDEEGKRKPTMELEEKSKGVLMPDVWEISIIAPVAKERLGYPTQKPEALLKRIIKASSNEGDLILDPFCGCGTTVSVAQELNRRWIGIDITHLAITLIRHRLLHTYGEDVKPKVIGEPTTLSGAIELAQQDPYQFQWWALGLFGARPIEQKKGADRGIDGKLYFFEESNAKKGKPKQIIFSVKAGNIQVSHVRDLRGVVERENAAIGVLISLHPSTRAMRREATSADFYTSGELGSKRYPKIQLLTIEEILNGKTIDCPPFAMKRGNVTFKKAPKKKIIREKIEQKKLT